MQAIVSRIPGAGCCLVLCHFRLNRLDLLQSQVQDEGANSQTSQRAYAGTANMSHLWPRLTQSALIEQTQRYTHSRIERSLQMPRLRQRIS